MISTPQLKLMKKSAVLINTARGGLVSSAFGRRELSAHHYLLAPYRSTSRL